MARTKDLSFLRSIKKEEQGNGNGIIKQQHTTFSFLFSSLIKEEQQNNNSSVVTDDDDDDDDRVCLHFSVGDPSCPSCDHRQQQQQQQETHTNKKRKRPQQQTLMNKKTRIINWDDHDDDDNHSICLHLLLGSSSCIPTFVHHDDQWEIKKVLEQSDVRHHMCRLMLKKEDAQQFVIPFLLDGAAQAQQAAQTKQGIQVQFRDADTHTLHSLVFKIWTSANCHIFTKRWVKDFVVRRDLKKGDQIGLRWDQENNRFDFSVLRRAKLFNS